MLMDRKTSKWLYLSAVFLFASATFQLAGAHMLLGASFFGADTCVISAAGI